MTLTDMMQDLVNRGCYPCCSYRGGGVYRAHINGAGNRWDEGRTPDSAMRKAFAAWKRDGFPMDGYACTGEPSTHDEKVEAPKMTSAARNEGILRRLVRQAVADYMYSEGCSCCRSEPAHTEHAARLGELLRVPKYKDFSGYDFSQFRSNTNSPTCELTEPDGVGRTQV